MIREEEIKKWLERIEAGETDDDFGDPVPDEQKKQEPRPERVRQPYQVLYEDADLLALDKRSGIAVIPERHEGTTCLKEVAEQAFGRLLTVHRIDKETSGVVLFARNEEVHRELNEQFRLRKAGKRYLVIVEGEMHDQEMRVDIPLGTDPRRAGSMKPSADGKESLTILRREESFDGFTLINAEPKTGRQHQIRVHCQAVGLPLLVDSMYGGRENFLLSSIKRKFRDYGREERPLIDRITLHAASLEVEHPGTGKPIRFEAEPPKDFRAVLTQLRKLRGRSDD